MDLSLNSDQIGLVDAVSKLVAPFRMPPPNSQETLLLNEGLDNQLQEAGFRDVARFDGMGPLDAVLLAEVVHVLPYTTEFINSALLGPALDIATNGPLALLQAPATTPARFVVPGAHALIAEGADAWLVPLDETLIERQETPFAYPLGKLRADYKDHGERLPGAAAPMRQWWGIALATEIGATAKAAVDLTIEYVKDRRQFGKPIGSYQAIQHRLAECMVAVRAVQILARRAASLGTQEAALAALVHAKEICPRIIYDTHQFQGAIGLTYEYPLHFYTYRLRVLHGELSSLADSADLLAATRWDDGPIDWCD